MTALEHNHQTAHKSSWPADERPRERLMRHGADSLSDAELLAIFLRTGTAGQPVMALSRSLIDQFGNLRNLRPAECWMSRCARATH